MNAHKRYAGLGSELLKDILIERDKEIKHLNEVIRKLIAKINGEPVDKHK